MTTVLKYAVQIIGFRGAMIANKFLSESRKSYSSNAVFKTKIFLKKETFTANRSSFKTIL